MAAKWLKSIPNLWPKRLKNHTLWDRIYLYSPYKGVPPGRTRKNGIGKCNSQGFLTWGQQTWGSQREFSKFFSSLQFLPQQITNVSVWNLLCAINWLCGFSTNKTNLNVAQEGIVVDSVDWSYESAVDNSWSLKAPAIELDKITTCCPNKTIKQGERSKLFLTCFG